MKPFLLSVSEQWLELDIGVMALVTNVLIKNRPTQSQRARDIQVRVGNVNVGNTKDQVSRGEFLKRCSQVYIQLRLS